MADYRTLLVPYDFSEHSRKALDTALDLGRRLGSDLHLLHVVATPIVPYPSMQPASVPPASAFLELRSAAEGALGEVMEGILDPPGKLTSHVVEGDAVAETIRRLAEEIGADLVVMGTHGRSGLARAFLGSVAERTLRLAPCPVLTVWADERERGAPS